MHLQDSDYKILMDLAERSIENDSTFVVDLEVKGQASNPTVWVYAESDKGGISLDECADISRRLQVMIEAHEVLGSTFTLNVSSPGLERPLKVKRQYFVNRGRTAKIRYTDEQSARELEGVIASADESGIEIEREGTKTRLDYSSIIETKITPVF